jgi:hypothetical protein
MTAEINELDKLIEKLTDITKKSIRKKSILENNNKCPYEEELQ